MFFFSSCVSACDAQDLMDKLATLQQQLQEAEDKKVALQDQVRSVGEEQTIGYSSRALGSVSFHAPWRPFCTLFRIPT